MIYVSFFQMRESNMNNTVVLNLQLLSNQQKNYIVITFLNTNVSDSLKGYI